MRKRKRVLLIAVLALAAGVAGSLYLPFPKSKLDPGPVLSLRITDRNGILLREVLSDEGGRCRWVGLGEVSPHVIRAALVSEDRNFFLHKGVNVLSVFRALLQNLRHGRIVSGASTISQQVVRNLGHRPRTLLSKLLEAWLAVRLEHTLSKEEILIQYLNRVPYGNLVYGAEAASRLYFEKPCSQLGPAEAAFLAGIPRSPSASNPYRDLPAALKRQKEILRSMARSGLLTAEEYHRTAAEDIRISPEADRFRAPHFCDLVLRSMKVSQRYRLSDVRTSLDFGLQKKVEGLLSDHLNSLREKGITNGSVVVLDNEGGDVLALAGSHDFFDADHGGQVNGALALRQPGSALKPFTYALALERGMTAASVIDDAANAFPTFEGNYEPQNYDRKFHGPIRMRSALACSYNVPAVAVLEAIGPDLLYRKLKDLGFDSLRKPPGFYGLGLTLGNGEVSLFELAEAYAALARSGRYQRARTIIRMTGKDGKEVPVPDPERAVDVLSPAAAFIITHILSDRDARVPAFGYSSPLNLPFPCAAKTGTSKDYRDNWTIGYTVRHTVGVWVGNFDGKPMHDVSGITGCGPLFRDIMLLLNAKNPPPPFAEPRGLLRRSICPLSGLLARASCPGRMDEIFVSGTEPREVCWIFHGAGAGPGLTTASVSGVSSRRDPVLRIIFPRDGSIFKIDPVLRKEYQTIGLKAHPSGVDGSGTIEWWVNGRMAGTSASPSGFSWKLEPGSYTIKAASRTGVRRIESRSVRIIVIT
jgi:penicillin-binding protein 1C